MTSGHPSTVDEAHAAAAAALQELHDEALRHLDAVARSLGVPAAGEQVRGMSRRTDAGAGPATLELPRRVDPPVATAA
ncbi:hypothetical protein [Blastococcus sp. SYSU DS0619]